MKCPICDGNATLVIKGKSLIYKCLESNCGKEVEREVIGKNSSNIKLRKIRERISKLVDSTEIPILISNIKKHRLENGLNQGEVSNALGVSPQRYGTIERCENIPTSIKIMEICRIYDLTFNDIYDIVYINEEQYKILNRLVAKVITKEQYRELEGKVNRVGDDSPNITIIEEDSNIELLEQEILNYEKETGITERKIFDNKRQQDAKDIVEIKKKLQKMDMDYTEYRKKQGAILKQKTVIDYYNWTVVKEIIGYKK